MFALIAGTPTWGRCDCTDDDDDDDEDDDDDDDDHDDDDNDNDDVDDYSLYLRGCTYRHKVRGARFYSKVHFTTRPSDALTAAGWSKP